MFYLRDLNSFSRFKVNKSDTTRVDLIVANDQHLYLKACDYKERQKWLVALASQKATYPNSNVALNSNSSISNLKISNNSNESNLINANNVEDKTNKISPVQQHLSRIFLLLLFIYRLIIII